MFKSEFSISRYYLQLYIYSLFYMLPLVFIIWPELFPAKNEDIQFRLVLFFFGVMLIGFFGFGFILRKAPRLIIYPEELVIQHLWKKRIVPRDEIKQINLISSARAGFFIFSQEQIEATVIETVAEEQLVFYAHYYSNMTAMRQALGNWAGLTEQGNEDLNPGYVTAPVTEEKPIHTFSGLFLRSFSGIAFYELLLLLIIVLFIATHIDASGLAAAVVFVWLFSRLFRKQAYYFLVSDNYLFVRSHLYPWFKRVHALASIKDIKFENPPRRSIVLQVTTSNFQTFSYGAGSLRNKTWKALQEKLEEHHIPVRNEAIIG